MPLTRLHESDTLFDVLRHIIIRLHLACNQLNRLLRQTLRQTHNTIQIRNQEIAWMNRRILILTIETYRRIDGAYTRNFLWSGGADVASENL